MSTLRAIVVGGGIGGLTAAIALARKGVPVTLLEQTAELGEIGAGIQLSPNATRVLFAFDLERALGEVAFRPEAVEARTWRLGVLLSRVPLGAAVVAQFGRALLARPPRRPDRAARARGCRTPAGRAAARHGVHGLCER